jgi:hypothetical protein
MADESHRSGRRAYVGNADAIQGGKRPSEAFAVLLAGQTVDLELDSGHGETPFVQCADGTPLGGASWRR